MNRNETHVRARDGTIIRVNDIVQTVQDTIFLVTEYDGKIYLERPEGFYSFTPDLSPNLWIIGNLEDTPELVDWKPN